MRAHIRKPPLLIGFLAISVAVSTCKGLRDTEQGAATGAVICAISETTPDSAGHNDGTASKTGSPSFLEVAANLQIQTKGRRDVLLPPADGVYLGAFLSSGTEDDIDADRVKTFQDCIGRELGWVYFSQNWGAGIRFPAREVDTLTELGITPFIRLMPRSGFDAESSRASRPDEAFSLASILEGTWDADLRSWAQSARDYRKPLLLDFAPEMNGDFFRWSGWANGGGTLGDYGSDDTPDGPERYRDAYRHVVDIFREEKAINVTWVFHPTVHTVEWPAWNDLSYYYPGDDYVDWVGVSVYGVQYPDEPWQTFDEVFAETYRTLVTLAPDKPFLVAEFGVREDEKIASRKAQWIKDALRAIETSKYPNVRGVSYWHEAWKTADGEWIDLRVNSSRQSLESFVNEVRKPIYLSKLQFSGR